MDILEKKIEQYKQELMKYAQKHGTVYGGESDGFKQIEPSPEYTNEYNEKNEEKPKIKYNEKYTNNRPMPSEYEGNEETAPEIIEESEILAPEAHEYLTYEDFIKANANTGKLKIQAYASQQAFPIANAKVDVNKEFGDGTHTFAQVYTDIDGIAENIVLPTKNKALSLTAGGEIPFATYRVTVSHPNFVTQIYENVPIFDTIESLQPAAMRPMS